MAELERMPGLVQLISVAQLCPTLCDPMDCSTPGLPVHYQLLELPGEEAKLLRLQKLDSGGTENSPSLPSPIPPSASPPNTPSLCRIVAVVESFSRVRLCATAWTVDRQAVRPREFFPERECWSGWPRPWWVLRTVWCACLLLLWQWLLWIGLSKSRTLKIFFNSAISNQCEFTWNSVSDVTPLALPAGDTRQCPVK